MITKDQFLRGIAAVLRHDQAVKSIREAWTAAGVEDYGIGMLGDPLAHEVVRQLEERCNDADHHHGSMITYMLYDCGGPVTWEGQSYMTRTAEELWAYWEASKSGPFSLNPKPEGEG